MEAAFLNSPLIAAEGVCPDKALQPVLCIGSGGFPGENAHVAVDAVKQAEDGGGFIVRLHEFAGIRGTVELSSSYAVKSWQECDLLERPAGEESAAPVMKAAVQPYEIKTYLLRF
ncbi:hypothetical protein D3C76_1647200 [compost metagenome]